MANIKRLIFRKFGGTSNFILFVLIVASCYVLIRNFIFSQEFKASTLTLPKVKEVPITEKVAISQPNTIDPGCEIQEKCHENAIPYKLISGEGMNHFPTICFNGKLLVDKDLKDNKIGRGINMVVLNKDNFQVKSIDAFDTFINDAQFYRKLGGETVDGDIVLIASYDEMATAIREPTVALMEQFGSQLFGKVKFRDSFVMVGQRGVAKGKAVELSEQKGNRDFAAAAKIDGCIDLPLGPITPVVVKTISETPTERIVSKKFVKNCGLREPCKENEFAVHVYTGKDRNDEPKICVDGRYVIEKNTNDAGRGLNLVVIGNGKEVLKVVRFDTYAEDSTNLEIFLEGLHNNVILIALTFDDASTKLGNLARNLFYELGSGYIQNLKHRDAWYFVGRKGIDGFTPIEEISYAGPENAYPVPLDRKFCVPQTLKGMRIRPDPLPVINDRRRDFCSKFDGYGDFCTSENIDKPLLAAPIINKTLEDHPVYDTPVMVVGAMSHNSLRMTLETLIMQPGIRSENVFVCIDEKLTELGALVDLFGFHYVKIESSFNYTEIMHKAFKKIFESGELIDESKKAVIVIEEELILSPDFLYFFFQVYDIFVNDPSLIAVSTFNPNSYQFVEGSSAYVYRTSDFPGFGFMLKRSAYNIYIKGKLNTCCLKRAWYNWNLTTNEPLDVLVPDVSRVFRRPYDISSSDFAFLNNLFNRRRKTNLIPFPELAANEHLASRNKYNAYLKEYIKNAVEFPNAIECYSYEKLEMPTTINTNYKIVFEQQDANDLSNLKKLCRCFNLFADEYQPPKSLYLGSILRFHSKQNNYLLIGSKNTLLAS